MTSIMKYRWRSIFAWNVGLLLLALFSAELVFGSWFRAPALWQLSIYKNVNWTIPVKEIYGRNEPIAYNRDYFGLRGNHGTPGAVNILTIGGSTTDERKIDNRETWPRILQTCLRGRGVAATLANAGVAGQSTRGHILNFKYWLNHIPNLKPKYTVAFIGFNDRSIDHRQPFEDPRYYTEFPTAPGRIDVLIEWIKINSAVYALWRAVRGNLRAIVIGIHPAFLKKPAGPAFHGETQRDKMTRKYGSNSKAASLVRGSATHKSLVVEYTGRHGPALNAYRVRLSALNEEIRKFGSTPIFISQGNGGYRFSDNRVTGSAEAFIEVDAWNAVFKDHCRKTNTFCVDLAGTLSFGDGDLYDPVHTTPQGSKRIGKAICEALLTNPDFRPVP